MSTSKLFEIRLVFCFKSILRTGLPEKTIKSKAYLLEEWNVLTAIPNFIQQLTDRSAPNCGFCFYCREFSCFHGEGGESKKVWFNLRRNEKLVYLNRQNYSVGIKYLELLIICLMFGRRLHLIDIRNVVFVAGNPWRQFATSLWLFYNKPMFTFIAIVNMVEIIVPSWLWI